MDDYPLPKYHFMVEAGMDRVGFTECSGLDIETEIIEYRDGFDPNFVKSKLPGLKKTANVVLKRAMMRADNEFFKWVSTVYYNKAERRPVIISLLDETHQPVVTWTLKNAWPAKLASTDMKADGNEVTVETLEIAHEGITIKAPG